MASVISVDIQGTCRTCSTPDLKVLHDSNFCWKIPATVMVDWNGTHLATHDDCSRQVFDGERVIVVGWDHEEDPILKWATVHPTGGRLGLVFD